MTKKVKKEDLKKLIENALKPSALDFFRGTEDAPETKAVTTSSFMNGMNLIAGQAKEIDEIDVNDLQELIKDPERVSADVQHALIYFTKLGQMSPANLKKVKDKAERNSKGGRGISNAKKDHAKVTYIFLNSKGAEKKIKELGRKAREVLKNFEEFRKEGTKGIQSVSSPDLDPSRIELGDLPEDYVQIIKSFLGAETDIVSRLEKISEVSDKYFAKDSGELPEGQSISQTLTEIMILDLFNHVVKELDAGSGAYFFEAILALLSGGQSTGKKLTDAGKAGAYDFIDVDNNYGSAKYFTTANAELKQAISGFKALAAENANQEVRVRYVIALKKQDEEQRDNKLRGSSDPRKIIALQIYTPLVTYDPGNDTFKIDGVEWEGTKPLHRSDSDIYLHNWIQANTPSTFLRLARIRTETFRAGVTNKINNEKQSMVSAFDAFKKYFEFLTSAEEQARIYSSTGAVEDGTNTITQLNGAKGEVNNLMAAFKKEKDETVQSTNEHKITEDFIKKLIQEKFKR